MDKFARVREVIAQIEDGATATEVLEALAEIESAFNTMQQALIAAINWLAEFGEHAPIRFGGEADLASALSVALRRSYDCLPPKTG